MCKNALEAIDFKEQITIAAERINGQMQFSVHNHTHIPLSVQDQLFKRSFSTKATDRGLGTYSMKMLVERYLKGKISFTSTAEGGTTFYVLLPK